MALNQLSEKLDTLTEQDLGFEFDNSVVWSKLEQRLDNRKAYAYWWVAAACLMIGMTLLPISLMKTVINENPAVSNKMDTGVRSKETVSLESQRVSRDSQKILVEEFPVLIRKGIEPTPVAVVSNVKLFLEPLAVPDSKQVKKAAFAAEDISIIQASLEQPKIEKGTSITIRAQLQASSQPVQLNNQTLKIKLSKGSNH